MNIVDDDSVVFIDVSTKEFNTDISKTVHLVKDDHNSEQITFNMMRYVENIDLSACDKIEIHYINISPSSKEKSEGIYTVTDRRMGEGDNSKKFYFTWLISRNVTKYAGSINFIIKFLNLDEDNNVIYSWSTVINKSLTVGESLDCDGVVDEEYSDILAQWEEKITKDIVNSLVITANDVEYNNTNSGLKSDNVQDAIDELSAENDDLSEKLDAVSGIVFESWSDVQKIVRKGLASSVFNIGDQFVTQDNYNGEEMIWDVIGFDCDTPVDSNYTHSMTIQLHDCHKLDFDAPEAAYAINSELVAGQYYFTINGRNYSFTLDMPRYYPGCQIVFNPVKNPNIVYTYEGFYEAAPYLESASVSSDTAEGTFLEETNDYRRILYGSNDWYKSSARLWLNSDNSDRRDWWIPDMVTPHVFDRPPQINSYAGFLCHLDPELLAVLGKVKKETYSTADKKMTETEDLMFLLSKSEINASTGTEGEPYPFYKNTNSLGRVKRFNDGSVCKKVALRTANKDISSIWSINETGSLKSAYAYNTFGIAPACCIV